MLIILFRGVMKIRYLLLGGAIGGGASVARQYEEWKKALPDTDWIKEMMPEVDTVKFRAGLVSFKNKYGWNLGLDFKLTFPILQVERES